MAKYQITTALIIMVSGSMMGQSDAIPEWFFEDLEIHEGRWIADNTKYESDAEPFDAFGMEWRKSALQVSMTGRLFGMKDGKEVGTFWEYREYWDPIEQEVMVLQFGPTGIFGKGVLKHMGNGHFESIQTFATPDGETSAVKHNNTITAGKMISISFKQSDNGEWVKDREYVWYKQ